MKRREFIKSSAVFTAVGLTIPVIPSIARTAFANTAPKPTVYFGGPILTMNASNDIVEAVLVENGKIIATGTEIDIFKRAGNFATKFDLEGQTLMPGMIDGHSHFVDAGASHFYSVSLNAPPIGEITCIEDIQRLLSEKVKTCPEGDLILGFGYDNLELKEQRHPTREELDEVSTKHPIIIQHVSGHAGVANSKAFELAKVTAETIPATGILEVKNGKLTGLMQGGGAFALLYVPEIPMPKFDYAKCIAYDSNNYASHGITTANSGESNPKNDIHLIEASENDSLKVRVVMWPKAQFNNKALAIYGDKRSGAVLDKKGKVILGAVKLIADGSPQGYTAHFSKPYYKQMSGQGPDYKGISYFKSPEIRMQRIKDLHQAGWQMATHTNGDQAIEDVLSSYTLALKSDKRNDHRHILNHCQFNTQEQIPRMAELEVIPSYFVTHTYFWGDTHRNLVAGPKMAAHISPCKAALDNSIPFVLHNDTPITPIDPLLCVYSAVNRLTLTNYILGPDQRIAVMEALRGVTINAAHMYFMEDKIGSLEENKLADMVILSENPLDIKPEKIKDIKVVATFVGGEEIYHN